MRDDTTDFLLAPESTQITDDLADLMDDTTISISITYKSFTSTSLTVTTGAYSVTSTSLSIRVIRTVLTLKEVQASQGLYQMGDVRYLAARSDLTVTPTREDRITEGSDEYELISWETDLLSVTWDIIARRVK